MDVSKVDRLEVIDQHGRILVLHEVTTVLLDLQDDGQTLKVFLNTQEQTG